MLHHTLQITCLFYTEYHPSRQNWCLYKIQADVFWWWDMIRRQRVFVKRIGKVLFFLFVLIYLTVFYRMREIGLESDRGHRDEFGTLLAQEAMIHSDLIGINVWNESCLQPGTLTPSFAVSTEINAPNLNSRKHPLMDTLGNQPSFYPPLIYLFFNLRDCFAHFLITHRSTKGLCENAIFKSHHAKQFYHLHSTCDVQVYSLFHALIVMGEHVQTRAVK